MPMEYIGEARNNEWRVRIWDDWPRLGMMQVDYFTTKTVRQFSFTSKANIRWILERFQYIAIGRGIFSVDEMIDALIETDAIIERVGSPCPMWF